MTFKTIKYEKKDAVCTITLNQPDVNKELIQEIVEASGDIAADNDIKVVVITGTGNMFSRGAAPSENTDSITIPQAASAIAGIACPVIAAINGDAIGQGLELALACDIRIAVDSAQFGLPYIKSGHIPQDGGTQLLPRIVGKAKAIEMILTGETIGAQEAMETGLITRMETAKQLASAVQALCKTIADQSPLAVRHAKEAVIKGLDMTLEQGLRLEGDLYFLLQTTEDRTEGIKAFLEKRQPNFKGN